MPKKDTLTITLRYVPVLRVDSDGIWNVGHTVEVKPDPAYLSQKVNFKKVEWVVLNQDDVLAWEISTKSGDEIASFDYPENTSGPLSKTSNNKMLVPKDGTLSYTIKISGWNRWGIYFSLTKDPEIHWGRRG